MPSLQPYLVFKSETTRLNTLYWSSKYSYTRSAALLKVMADTGRHAVDPRVDQIWGSSEIGEASIAAVPLSAFIKTLEDDAEALRTTSILQVCSAFENALCGYFSLCCLYQPKKDNPAHTGAAVPSLLKTPNLFEARKKVIKKRCEDNLHGKYKKRINFIIDTWALPKITTPALSRLDTYYSKRHLIAHDQSLDNADSPDHSASEIICRRITIDEATWKAMISDFDKVLLELDEIIRTNVITDGGVSLAIHRIVDRDGPQSTAQLKGKVIDEWRVGSLKGSAIMAIASAIGMKTKQLNGKHCQVFR